VAEHDGNGWVEGPDGARRWGLYGAAGLLLVRPGPEVLLQLRADWTHFGGTWSLVGGARDSHEDVVAAALREAREEAGLEPDDVRVLRLLPGASLGPWSYTYVLAWARDGVVAEPRTAESTDVRWFSLDGVGELPLHEGLAADWDRLAEAVLECAAAASSS
jgi:8-oxo-dGTP diphosphatase